MPFGVSLPDGAIWVALLVVGLLPLFPTIWLANRLVARVVSIAFEDDPETVAEFFEREGGDWPVLLDSSVTAIEWSGLYAFDNIPPIADDFTIEIYSDAAGLPGILLDTFSVGDNVNRTDSAVRIGAAAASSAVIRPPFDCTISNRVSPTSRASRWRRPP